MEELVLSIPQAGMHVGDAPSTQVPGCLCFSHPQAEMLERETLAASKALQLRHEAQAAIEAKHSRVRNSAFWVSVWRTLMASGIQTKNNSFSVFPSSFLTLLNLNQTCRRGPARPAMSSRRFKCQTHTAYPAPREFTNGCCQLWSMEGLKLKILMLVCG